MRDLKSIHPLGRKREGTASEKERGGPKKCRQTKTEEKRQNGKKPSKKKREGSTRERGGGDSEKQ